MCMSILLYVGINYFTDDIHLLYITCAFETAWNQLSDSPWCIPFSTESFKVSCKLEVFEEIIYSLVQQNYVSTF